MDLLSLGNRRFHRFFRDKPEMLRQCGVLGPGAEDAGRVAEALQRVGGHDPVDGMASVRAPTTRQLIVAPVSLISLPYFS